MRKQWSRKIRPGDTVNFVTCVGGDPVTWLWIAYVVLVGVTVVLALNAAKVPSNLTADAPAADSVFSLRGQRNQIRLGEPIEVPYGRPRMWPSVAAQTFNQYIENKQWRYQLFSLGQGNFTIHDIQIEDTPIADFVDVNWELVPPGSPVTLFPTNVITVAEVAGIELLGTDEGGGGVYVVDSVGDPTAEPPIPETGHYNAAVAGPFVVNPTLTKTTRIEVDFQLPRGLYKQNSNGSLANLTITALVEVQEINDAGATVGAWFTLENWTKTLNTVTPQRYTLGGAVPLGRYRIRASRTNTKDASASAGNVLIWEAVRAFIPENTVDNGIYRIAVKARASNNLNDNSATRINVVATRHIPVWNGTTWTTQATRSPVWAFCDAFRAQYGARLADQYLELDTLLALSLTLADRNEFFDWVFDQKTTVWDVARTIAAACRAVPMLNGSRITMVRDDVKTFPVAVFNHENIKKDSFAWDIKLAELSAYDGLRIVYTNPDTWKEESVLCCLADEVGNNPEQRKIVGVTGREHAYHLGMYQRAFDRYVREKFSWETGMEGHIPSFGDMVAVSHDVPRWDSGGMVLEMSKTFTGGFWQYVFTLSEPYATFTAGAKSLLLRNKTSAAIGSYNVGPGPAANQVFANLLTADADLDALVFEDRKERPLYLFGSPDVQGKQVVISNLSPSEGYEVAIEGRPYDARLFNYDEATPPGDDETNGHLPAFNALPAVSGLRVTPAPIDEIDGGLSVVASWFPMPNARAYLVQYSYDAKHWTDVVTTQDLKAPFVVTARYLYVRVSALNTGQGAWAYWTGQAPVLDTKVVTPPSALVVNSSANLIVQPDGTAIPRAKVSWTLSTDKLVLASGRYRIQYKLAADSDWSDWGTVAGDQNFDVVTDVKIGTAVNFRVRAENKFGAVSTYIVPSPAAHTIAGDTTVANAVATVSATPKPGYNEIVWTRSTTVQVNEYKIFRNTLNTMSGAVKIGETDGLWFADSGFVGGLSAGTTYFYFIVPVSGSDVDGTVSGSANCTAATPPVGAAIPSAAGAPTIVSQGVYTDTGGKVSAFAVVRIQALPANAVWQNILGRVLGGSGETLWSTQKNSGATLDVRIDDLSPGVNYELAVQPWSGAGAPAGTPIAAPGYFTAATKNTGPAAPGSVTYVAGNSATFGRPAAFSNVRIQFSTRINFARPADKDIAFFEYVVTGGDSNGDADSAAAAGFPFLQRTGTPEVVFSMDSPLPLYFRVRAVNTSGVPGDWGGGGTSLATVTGIPGGNLANQNDNDVSVSAVKTGSGASVRQIKCVYESNDVYNLTGGAPTENVNVSLTNRGFSHLPDVGVAEVVDPAGELECVYEWGNGGNSSTNAVLKFLSLDRTSNIGGGNRRIVFKLTEYA